MVFLMRAAALAAAILAPFTAVAQPDILGIKLGDSVDQVRALVEAHAKGRQWIEDYEERDIPGKGSYTSMLNFRFRQGADTPSDIITVVFSTPFTGNRAVSIGRRLDYMLADVSPTVEGVIQSAMSKYGAHTVISEQWNNDSGRFNWHYDAAGEPAHAFDGSSACAMTPKDFELDPYNRRHDYLNRYSAHRNSPKDCPLTVDFSVWGNSRGMVSRFSATIADKGALHRLEAEEVPLLNEAEAKELEAERAAAPAAEL